MNSFLSIILNAEYTATSANLVLVGEKANEFRLHLTGSKSDLDALSPSHLSVKIDLSKAVEGKQSLLITEENILLPKGITLIDVVPSGLDITLAAIIKTEVLVKPQLVGKLPEGLEIASIIVKPEKVMALLPSGQGNDSIESVTTTPVYLESISHDTLIFCKIIASPSVQPVDKRWPDVEVNIFLKKQSP